MLEKRKRISQAVVFIFKRKIILLEIRWFALKLNILLVGIFDNSLILKNGSDSFEHKNNYQLINIKIKSVY